jgi:hypothetical protein
LNPPAFVETKVLSDGIKRNDKTVGEGTNNYLLFEPVGKVEIDEMKKNKAGEGGEKTAKGAGVITIN